MQTYVVCIDQHIKNFKTFNAESEEDKLDQVEKFLKSITSSSPNDKSIDHDVKLSNFSVTCLDDEE